MLDIEETERDLFLEALYRHYHYDFRGYSRSSVDRRLTQALVHFHCGSLSILQHRLLREPAILPSLLNFLTIQVSEMFRDPSYYRALRERVIPHLRTYPSIRLWIAGCANGEELYSMAILFREEGLENKTTFYATEINPRALQMAEAGIYDVDQIPLFTENHRLAGGRSSLSDYYTAAYGAAVFDKTLRSRAVFSEHSLATDAVFAEMHLISCRNVLIYFDKDMQRRAIGLFKDSLVRGGFLGLGSQETLRFSDYSDEFTDFIEPERIYRKEEIRARLYAAS